MSFEENISLSNLCTFGIGGPARYFIRASTIEQLEIAVKRANQENIPFIVIGKGSNCLFHDKGFNGLVIQNKIDFFETPDLGVYHVGAGFSFALLGVRSAQAGFSGLEFASGIPASVGGAVFMNAGANGSETCTALESVDYMDENGNLHHLKKENLRFGYRTSCFQEKKGIIAAATFRLKKSLAARQKQIEIVSYRTKTQPYGEKSAGCVFRNPSCGFAGQLIEESGLKGAKVGDAEISSKHANFIVNKGNATSDDVLALIDMITTHIQNKSSIHLESEIRVIPYDPVR
jgi:UDP-N-acetylmuramate dehydrogenase